MRHRCGCSNLPSKSFASLRGLCLKSRAMRISTAGDAAAAAAHYQRSSSSDMLWRLAHVRFLLLRAPPVSPLLLLKVTSAASRRAPAPRVQKARTQHEMGFIREQLRLLAYLNTQTFSNCIKRLSVCAESILISSCLPSQQQALSE